MLELNAPLNLSHLTRPLCCIVNLAIEGARPAFTPGDFIRPLQQVTLRPDKVSGQGFIRLGETQGDDAFCWIRPEHILILEVLGEAVEVDGKWTVHPIEQLAEAA